MKVTIKNDKPIVEDNDKLVPGDVVTWVNSSNKDYYMVVNANGAEFNNFGTMMPVRLLSLTSFTLYTGTRSKLVKASDAEIIITP